MSDTQYIGVRRENSTGLNATPDTPENIGTVVMLGQCFECLFWDQLLPYIYNQFSPMCPS